MSQMWWSGVGLVSAWLLVWATLRVVRRLELLVHPNERSSHVQPTPTGGGLAIAVLALAYLGVVVSPQFDLGWYWLAGAGLLAAVGLWDDFAELPARLRLLVQIMAALLVIVPMVQYSTSLDSGTIALVQWLWWIGATLALVWFINLYNFMDGIDGFAGLQCFGFCLGVLLIGGDVPGWSGGLLWILTGASLGFLSYNWPPAKIFMGDVGSLTLGLLLGGLVLWLEITGSVSIPASLILLSVFWVDASYTLMVRFLTGQTVTQAHRSHLYQHLAGRFGHFFTSSAFLGVQIVWLLPLAWYAAHLNNAGQMYAPWMLVALAVSPLVILCQRFSAGRVIDYKLDVTK